MICQRNHETMSTADHKKTMVSKTLMIRSKMLVARLKKITRLTLNAYIWFAHKYIKTADMYTWYCPVTKKYGKYFSILFTFL